jgi:hypothetical protein
MHPKLFIYVICKYLNLFTEYGLGDGIFQLMVARYINIHEIPYTNAQNNTRIVKTKRYDIYEQTPRDHSCPRDY